MAPIARLRHGANLIYFETGTAYSLGDDFIPPGSNLLASFSGGTSANVYGGSIKTGEKAENREVSFTVHCTATTKDNAAPQSLANRLVTLITKAGDEAAPVWFEWTLTPSLPEPIWGQFGAWRRAEIVHGSAQYASRLGQYSRNEDIEIVVTLTVKPFALGTRNQLAGGNKCEVDYFATSSFTQRGIRACPATTNKVFNPIFGNRTAWNTYWTAANLTAYENIDYDYIYPGFERSALLVCSATAGTFTTPVTIAATADLNFISAYVKRPDGAAVTVADCDIYAEGNSLSATFSLLGNGVYRATSTKFAVTSADMTTGLQVQPNRTIYLLGFQVESHAWTDYTPLAVGDVYPATWSGAAHASESIREDGTAFSVTTNVQNAQSNLSIAIYWDDDLYNYSLGDITFAYTVAGIRFYYHAADSKYYLTDGVNTISSNATVLNPARLVITLGDASMAIYNCGALIASGASHAVVAGNQIILVGYSDANSNPGGLFKAYEVYDQCLTLAQVQAIDAAWLACGEIIDPPQIENSSTFVQSPSATNPSSNYFSINCIDGNAHPQLDMEQVGYQTGTDIDTAINWTVLNGATVNLASANLLYDCSTAAVAVSASADEVLATWPIYRINDLMGETVWIATRLTDAGANLQLDFKLSMKGTSIRIGYKSVVADATMRMFYLGPLYIPSRAAFPERSLRNQNILATATLYAQRTTGGASNVEVDYVDVMLPNMLKIARTSAVAITTPLIYYWDGEGAILYDASIKAEAEQMRMIGGRIKLAPMARNYLRIEPCDNGEANATVREMSGTWFVTPRWSL
ncbi:MAG: hypothetical protein WC710_14265 [Gallionella sp.]|jgi:hypothetical protein